MLGGGARGLSTESMATKLFLVPLHNRAGGAAVAQLVMSQGSSEAEPAISVWPDSSFDLVDKYASVPLPRPVSVTLARRSPELMRQRASFPQRVLHRLPLERGSRVGGVTRC